LNRAVAYVDGFNLYFGLKAAGLRRYYWLDLPALASTFLHSGQALDHLHYFTARIRNTGPNQADVARQSAYLDALAVSPRLTLHEGHFLEKQGKCRTCGSTWRTYEEKMSDVNLAVQLVMDALDDRFDTAFVVSGDSDLATPIRRVLARFPSKRIIVAFPPKRHSADLKRIASGTFNIGEDKLRRSLLPDTVVTAAGVRLQRPATWC
jgi:uncharacterized LabA/DUF88 family protein